MDMQPETPDSPPPASPAATSSTPKFANGKNLSKWGLVLGAVILGAVGGYLIGSSKPAKTITAPATSETNMVTIPTDATVTAECVDERGKQYILPKDIPDGPIYDVHDGKVVAIEYLVGLKEVKTKTEMFMNLLLQGAKYDHITIMPTSPHAGFNEEHVHVIAAMLPRTDMEAIKCSAGTSTDEMHMH